MKKDVIFFAVMVFAVLAVFLHFATPVVSASTLGEALVPVGVERSFTSQKVFYSNGQISLTTFAGTRYVSEDGLWKEVEKARSLKNSGRFKCVVVEDADTNASCLDFNATSITLNISLKNDSKKNTNIALKHYESFFNSSTKNKDFRQTKISDLQFSKKDASVVQTVSYTFGDQIHVGENSTTVELKDANTEVTDTYIDSANPAADNSGGAVAYIANQTDGFGTKSLAITFNTTQIGSGVTINSAVMGLFVTEMRTDWANTTGTNNLTAYNTTGQAMSTWNWNSRGTTPRLQKVFTFVMGGTGGPYCPGGSCAVELTYFNFTVTGAVQSSVNGNSNNVSFYVDNEGDGFVENYLAIATQDDGTAARRPYLNVTYTPADTAPTALTAAVNLTNQSTKTSETLNLSGSCSDAEGNPCNVSFTVFKNNVAYLTFTQNLNFPNGSVASIIANDTNISADDVINVQVLFTSNGLSSGFLNSTKWTIAYTASTLGTAILNESNATLFINMPVNTTAIALANIDGSLSNVTFRWYVGTAVVRNTTFLNLASGLTPSDVFPASLTKNKGQPIRVETWAEQHGLNSTLTNSTAITVNNSNPASTIGNGTLNSTEDNNIVAFNLSQFFPDADNDITVLNHTALQFNDSSIISAVLITNSTHLATITVVANAFGVVEVNVTTIDNETAPQPGTVKQSFKINITSVADAPTVVLNSPGNGDVDRNATVRFIFTANDGDSPDDLNGTLFINGTNYGINITVPKGSLAEITNNVALTNATYTWWVQACDGVTCTNSSTATYRVDTVSPLFDWVNISANNFTGRSNLTAYPFVQGCSDVNLYQLLVNITDKNSKTVYYNFTAGINTTTFYDNNTLFNITNLSVANNNFTVELSCGDDGTDIALKEENWKLEKDSKELEKVKVKDKEGVHPYNLTLESSERLLDDIIITNLSDRFDIVFKTKNLGLGKDKSWKAVVRVEGHNLVYRQNSGFAGHFVLNDGQNWIKFIDAFGKPMPVTAVTKDGADYLVEMSFSASDSEIGPVTGSTNIVTEYRQFHIDNTNPTISLVTPVNGTGTSVGSAQQFNWTVSDDSAITQCTMYYATTSNTSTSITKDANQSLFATILSGDRLWWVGCYDEVGRTANSSFFTIGITPDPGSPSGPGSYTTPVDPAAKGPLQQTALVSPEDLEEKKPTSMSILLISGGISLLVVLVIIFAIALDVSKKKHAVIRAPPPPENLF